MMGSVIAFIFGAIFGGTFGFIFGAVLSLGDEEER